MDGVLSGCVASVVVEKHGQGIFQRNNVFDNTTGTLVKSQRHPTVRFNAIHDNGGTVSIIQHCHVANKLPSAQSQPIAMVLPGMSRPITYTTEVKAAKE